MESSSNTPTSSIATAPATNIATGVETTNSAPEPMAIEQPSPTTNTDTTTKPVEQPSTPVPELDLNKFKPTDVTDSRKLTELVEMLMQQRQRESELIEQMKKDAEIGRQAIAERQKQEETEKQNKRTAFGNMLADVIEKRADLHKVMGTDPTKDLIFDRIKNLETEFKNNPDKFMDFETEVRTAHAATAQQFVFLETKQKETETFKQELDRLNNDLLATKQRNEEISNAINNAKVFKDIGKYLTSSPFNQFKTNSESQMNSGTPISQLNISNPASSAAATPSPIQQKFPFAPIDTKQLPFVNQMLNNTNTTPPASSLSGSSLVQTTAHTASALTPTGSAQKQETPPPQDYTKSMSETYANISFQDILLARLENNPDYVKRSVHAASANASLINTKPVTSNKAFVPTTLTPELNNSDPRDRLCATNRLPFLFDQVPSLPEWNPEAFKGLITEGRKRGLGIIDHSDLQNQINTYNAQVAYSRFGHQAPPELGHVHSSANTFVRRFSDERNQIFRETGIQVI